jgi:hypothetical protein
MLILTKAQQTMKKELTEIKQKVLKYLTPPHFDGRGVLFLVSLLIYALIQLGNKHLFSDYIFEELYDPYAVVDTSEAVLMGVIGGIARLLGEFCGMILLTSIISVVKWLSYTDNRLDSHPIIYFTRSFYLFIPIYFFVDMIEAIIISSGYHEPERLQIFWISIGVIIGICFILIYVINSWKLLRKHQNSNQDNA